jgi:hypothetical protein
MESKMGKLEEQAQNKSNSGKKSDSRPIESIVEMVSFETLVSILVKKGIFTADELYAEERKRDQDLMQKRSFPIVQTERKTESYSQSQQYSASSSRGKHTGQKQKTSWLKRKMCKRRWTRRLGSNLFGWEWKKVRRENSVNQLNIHAGQEQQF